MKIAVSHLTRMQQGYICVAGIDLQSGQHIRPVLRRQMPAEMLARRGGVFEMGAVVELGRTRPLSDPPEVEDTLFRAGEAKWLYDMPSQEFWQLLNSVSYSRLIEIFGPELERIGKRGCAMPAYQGKASLGCLRSQSPRLQLIKRDQQQRLRMTFRSGQYDFDVPVTDIRLFGADHVTPNRDLISRTARRLAGGTETLLSVGLGRRFKKTSAEPARHWLQVNNIHFADHPCWTLSSANGH